MIGKSSVEVLREVTGDNSIQTIPEGLQAALSGGGGGGVFIVNANVETFTLDKTWQEILDAGFAILKFDTTVDDKPDISLCCLYYIQLDNETYKVGFYNPSLQDIMHFSTDSADGYPAFVQD